MSDWIGYAGGFIVAVSLIPQVIKSWRTKSTHDISITWTLIYIFGLILWVVYGVDIKNGPLVITVSVECLLAISLLILKIKHG